MADEVEAVPSRFFIRRRTHFFIKKEFNSMNYDICENEIYMYRLKQQNYFVHIILSIRRYINFVIVGIATGLIGCFLNFGIHFCGHVKTHHLHSLIANCSEGTGCLFKVFFVWFSWISLFVFIGSYLVTYIEPGAAGGGVPGVIAYLNGVDMRSMLTPSVIIFKCFSCICTCSSGIAGGKEGPMIHIGAAVGAVVVLIPLSCYLSIPFRNDNEMRDLVVAGVGCGVSAAFGSPIGGFLLAVEESASFLTVSLLFKCFLASLFSGITYYTMSAFFFGVPGHIMDLKLLYIGHVSVEDTSYNFAELPMFVAVGVLAGLTGALLVYVQERIQVLRRKFIKRNWNKLVEAMCIALVTTICHFLVTFNWKGCSNTDKPGNAVKVNCKNGYNEISLLTLNLGEEFLRWIISASDDNISLNAVLAILVMYIFLSMITAQISIAIGIFVPNLIIGALWGRTVAMVTNKVFPGNSWARTSKYALIGAGAQLSGALRITFSVTVIMCETSQTIHLMIPLMITFIIARHVGEALTHPIFESQILYNGIPYLLPEPPPFASEMPVQNIMSIRVITLGTSETVRDLINIISSNTYSAYPVVEKDALIGIVLVSDILILVKHKIFVNENIDMARIFKIFTKEFSNIPKIQDIAAKIETAENNRKVNLAMIMNPCPYSIKSNMSTERAYRLFRNLGLRHLIVINKNNQAIGVVTRKDLAKYHAGHGGNIELPII